MTSAAAMKPTILIIDDDYVLRKNVAEVLTLENFDVLEAENGGMGLGMLQIHKPDLIICDINMPDFTGYQVLQHVRMSPTHAKVPFLFITSMADRKSMRQGMELGADDYITKPFTNEELIAAVHARLHRLATVVSVNEDELDKAKKNLTQLVAHELRTPLTSVVMIEQLIDRKIDTLSKEQVVDLLDSWKAGAHRLHHLVEQMVLMTQIDADALNAVSIQKQGEVQDAWTVLQDAVKVARQFAYRHPHGAVRLNQPSGPLNVRCHPQSLRHALAEIISNALDFSPEGTEVLINLSKYTHPANQRQYVRIAIVDTGAGLTTQRLERALQPFEQIDRHKQEQQGMGLGLPLAKKILELHRGGILFRKAASGGTMVVLQLPLAAT